MYDFDEIKKVDSEIADAIKKEMERQNSHIELIASENWVSKAVMAAMGSPLTNKYAEDVYKRQTFSFVPLDKVFKRALALISRSVSI